VRVKHEFVDFRISRRILWVGMQAYPLQQVTRVQPIEVKPRRGRIVLRYGRRAGATLGLGLVALVFLGCLGDAVPRAASVVAGLLVLAALVFHTVWLIRALIRPPLHILSVATAGSAKAALVSTDRQLIHNLTFRVVDAIDNPAAEYQIQVEHLEFVGGDKVAGNKYGGDHVEQDKIVEGWS